MPGRKGSILIITLWILAILVVFSLGLARRAALNLRIASYQRDKMQAGYLARAGVNQAIQLLKKEISAYDTRENCGISLGIRQAQDVFSKKWGEGANDGFKIGFIAPSGDFTYGFQDEESRINLNGLGQNVLGPLNKGVLLKELFGAKDINGYEPLAAAVAGWTSADTGTTDDNPIKKGGDFCRQEELLAVLEYFYNVKQSKNEKESRKSAQETYNNLESFLTVFPKKAVNINTVSDEALGAVVSALAIAKGQNENIANTVTGKLIQEKSGKVITDVGELKDFWSAGSVEDVLLGELRTYLTCKSEYFRFTVIGQYRGASKEITVVYHRPNSANSDGKIVYWRER